MILLKYWIIPFFEMTSFSKEDMNKTGLYHAKEEARKLLEQSEGRLHIRLRLMSCRVLKREMEDVMMNVLVQEAKKRGIKEIIGYYFPTKKNRMVEDFYPKFGFKLINEDKEQKIWSIVTDGYRERSVPMLVENLL